MLTIAFGAIMDIPWFMLVLVRSRLITPQAIAQKRKTVVLIIAVLAAVLSPPDPVSQIVLIMLMVILFEIGLLMCRFMVSRPAEDKDKEQEQEQRKAKTQRLAQAAQKHFIT